MELKIIFLLLLPALLSFAVTYLLVPAVRRVAPVLGLLDMPSERRVHQTPIPRCGGIAVFIGVQLSCAVFYLTPYFPHYSAKLGPEWWLKYLALSSGVFALGLLDDRVQLRPLTKLFGQLVVACAAFYCGFNVGGVLGVTLPPPVDFLITVFWFTGAINAFNFIDGMDGVAGGLGAIAALAVSGQILLQGNSGDAVVTLALAAACVAFLRYNFHPASIFLGDGGSMFIGFSAAAFAVSLSAKGATVASLGVPLLAVGVPAFDTFLAIWRRSIRRLLRKSQTGDLHNQLFGADLDHLHHRLQRLGLSQRQVALTLYGLSASLVAVGLVSLLLQSHALAIYMLAVLAGIYVTVRHLAYVELWDSTTVLLNGLRRPPKRAIAVILYPLMDASLLGVALVASLTLAAGPASLADLRRLWLLYAPVWIGFPFLALVFTKTYQRVWGRARVYEFITAGGAVILGGGLAAFSHSLAAERVFEQQTVFLFLYWGIAASLIVGLRMVPRMIQDFSVLLRRYHARLNKVETVNVLVYGAGYNCTLYLRARSFAPVSPADPHYNVVGLMDDDTNLHGRFVHGCPVLGGVGLLAQILHDKQIDELVVTASLREDVYQQVLAAVVNCDVKVVRWRAGLYAEGYDALQVA